MIEKKKEKAHVAVGHEKKEQGGVFSRIAARLGINWEFLLAVLALAFMAGAVGIEVGSGRYDVAGSLALLSAAIHTSGRARVKAAH